MTVKRYILQHKNYGSYYAGKYRNNWSRHSAHGMVISISAWSIRSTTCKAICFWKCLVVTNVFEVWNLKISAVFLN